MREELKKAIDADDAELVRAAIAKAGARVTGRLAGGLTPLLYACQHGKAEAIEPLIRAGAVAERSGGPPSQSAFTTAALAGHVNVLEKLAALSDPPQSVLETVLNRSALQGQAAVLSFLVGRFQPPITGRLVRLAATSKQPEALAALLRFGADVNGTEDTAYGRGYAALHTLAMNEDLEAIRLLLHHGAAVDARDERGATPLMIAAAAGQLGSVRLLLDSGADPQAVDAAGNDALAYYQAALRKGARPVAEVAAALTVAGAAGAGETDRLLAAVRAGDFPAAQAAIAAGVDVNRVAPAPDARTPLSAACGRGDASLVRLLLDAGARPDLADATSTPLVTAARAGHLEVVRLLLAAGANVAQPEPPPSGVTPYTAARLAGEVEVAEYLRSAGGQVTAPGRLAAGVAGWTDFGQVLVRADAARTTRALAAVTGLPMQLGAYGRVLPAAADGFVVVQPKGMTWSNVLWLGRPARQELSDAMRRFLARLAQAAKADALFAGYSDTANAAVSYRVAPDGRSSFDDGRDTAPRPTSPERLEALAVQERFVLNALHLPPGGPKGVRIEFGDYAPDAFEDVAVVTLAAVS